MKLTQSYKELMINNLIKCAECGKEIDNTTTASCHCRGCQKSFCDTLHHTCFSIYHLNNKDSCENPFAMNILDPTWVINLKYS